MLLNKSVNKIYIGFEIWLFYYYLF